MTKIENRSISAEKSGYLRLLETALGQTRAKLAIAERKIDIAIQSGRISGSDQLLNAKSLAQDGLIRFENCLEELTRSSDLDWEYQRSRAEVALEDFSDSVRKVVSRFR